MLGCIPSSATDRLSCSKFSESNPSYHQRFPGWKLTMKFMMDGTELPATDPSNHSLCCTNGVRLQDVDFVYSSICYHAVLVYKQDQASSPENYWITWLKLNITVFLCGHFFQYFCCSGIQGSVIRVVTRYVLDGPRIDFQLDRVSCAIQTVPKAYLAPVQWILGLSWGKVAGAWCWPNHLLLLPGYI